ncbi:isochorismate synthase MenF [Mechercharimyces sp. CAU 1602]|uniref:isochorismate synthase n=1 Tax=Mechercharimyces sp. CAU 1602 TaxID=2973933 RepID=UPI002163AB36|nr:isochorismate synthase [Mechercharimyces sp. CAU 1602]MCS1351579.1 isochorismate synthase [Mechercharimyces sp. CAU 1602]
MTATQYSTIVDLSTEAFAQANQTGQPVLLSVSERVEGVSPLVFFHAGKEHYGGKRAFWGTPTNDLTLVGLGYEYIIETEENETRFQFVQTKWSTLLERSFVDKKTDQVGVGPLLLGGFSFDPLKEKDVLWEKYKSASMVLPTFLLSATSTGTWLTMNRILMPGMKMEDERVRWQHEWNELLQHRCTKGLNPPSSCYTVEEVAPEAYLNAVANVAYAVRTSELDKAVIARELRLSLEHSLQAEHVLKRLADEQSGSYLFAFEREGDCFIGATPERLVKKKEDELLSTCLAGTTRRGKSPSEDKYLGDELLHDQKNREEHAVVVRKITEAYTAMCGEVDVPEAPVLLKLRDYQHLYTPVSGQIKKELTLLDVVAQMHPTPALGGHPSARALEVIRQEEKWDRGWYAAPIGWIDQYGDGEFVVAIRSGLLRDNYASLFAGGGIMGDSNPVCEYLETQTKFRPMLSALGVRPE